MGSKASNGRVGHLSRCPGGPNGLPRWALCHPNRSVAILFEADTTRAAIRRLLARNGLVLREDDEVWPAEPALHLVWEGTLARLLPRVGKAQPAEGQERAAA